MKKIIYIVLIALLAVGGIYYGTDFFRGVKDGFNSTQQKEASKEVEAVANNNVRNDVSVESEPEVAVSTKVEDDSIYSPAIWKIYHQGKTSYLFGSIHFGDESMFPLPEKVTSAFEQSDVLAVEIDMDQKAMMEVAQYMNQLAVDMDNPLSSVLTPRTKERYDDYCLAEKLSCSSFEHFEPWYLFMNFTSMAALKSGLNPNLGIDKFFLDEARGQKEIIALETVKSQIDTLDGFSKPLQDSLLYGVMAPLDIKQEMKQLAVAWKQGNIDSFLDESFEKMVEGDEALPPEQVEEYMTKFLYDRNQVMADGIAQQINQGKSVFAVVGAAHYAGKNSVNQYLEEKGFKVERL